MLDMTDTQETHIALLLRQATEGRLDRIEKKLDTMTDNMISSAQFTMWAERIVKNETRLQSHDVRLAMLERVTWLLGIVGGLALAIITALLVAWATGNVTLVWR